MPEQFSLIMMTSNDPLKTNRVIIQINAQPKFFHQKLSGVAAGEEEVCIVSSPRLGARGTLPTPAHSSSSFSF